MEADRFKNLPIAGTYGDAAVFESTVEFDATANPAVVDFADLQPGTRILGVTLIHDALGAATTLQVGARYPAGGQTDDPDKYIASGASTSAGRRESQTHPEDLTERTIITGTLGGGPGTGKVTVLVHYKFRGPM